MTTNKLFEHDLISTKNLDLPTVELILKTAEKFKKHPVSKILKDKIIANCFFEPSTRTRLSFEAAALRLGAQCIGFSSDDNTSVKKGETLADTMRIISGYADLIVIRHPLEGSAALAAEIAECPVINAGDGANQHPTQALLDLFSIQESQGKINGLSIALVGDLKYGRTIHSFTNLCSLFDVRLYLVSPESLTLPANLCDHLKKSGIRFSFHQDLSEVINKVDIVYMTRIQQERFGGNYIHQTNGIHLNASMLKSARENLKVLHPLPRVDEIASDVDQTNFAYYFQQARNGLCVRQALLSLLLNESVT